MSPTRPIRPVPVQLSGRSAPELRSVLDQLTPLVDVLHPWDRRQSDTDAALEACRHYVKLCRRRLRDAGRSPDEIVAAWHGWDDEGGGDDAGEGESFRGVGRPSVD